MKRPPRWDPQNTVGGGLTPSPIQSGNWDKLPSDTPIELISIEELSTRVLKLLDLQKVSS